MTSRRHHKFFFNDNPTFILFLLDLLTALTINEKIGTLRNHFFLRQQEQININNKIQRKC
jgi:hypothetical protein